MSSSASDQDVQTTIHQAIQSARYNEAVIVSVSDNDGNAKEIVLVGCLDKEHGGIVWRDATSCAFDETSTDDIRIVRHLRTKLWAIPMLNDHVRNAMYDCCVRDACRTVVEKRLQEADGDDVIRILDIGSGTGLIAMMAAKHCKDAIVKLQKTKPEKRMRVQVTSVEMASAMARLARLTIDENESVIKGGEVESRIVVVECHSTDEEFFIQDSRFEEQSNNHQVNQSEAQQRQQQFGEPKKADLCTSELLDSGLLGEGVLPSLRDAWKRHLKPDALVLPRAARVVAMLVEGEDGDSESSSCNKLNMATAFYGPDLDSFQRASGGVWLATTPHKTDVSSDSNDGVLLGVLHVVSENADGIFGCDPHSSGGITIPLHASAIIGNHINEGFSASLFDPLQEYKGYSLIPDAILKDSKGKNKVIGVKEKTTTHYRIRPLTDPATVLSFDFSSGLSTFPSSDGRLVPTTFVPIADGIADGVLYWWELDLGEGEANIYSTVPLGCSKTTASEGRCMQWQDHWQQCLFLFGDGDRTRELIKGCPLHVFASHDDYSISFAMSDSRQKIDSRPVARRKLNDGSDTGVSPMSQPKINQHISPARALQLNDATRTEVLRDAIEHALSIKGTKAPFLDLSDMGLCSLIAAISGATCVTSLESNISNLAATISQIGNGLPKDDSIFQVIEALSENVTSEYIAGNKAEIVAAEPFYQMLEGWHIQEALNYFYLVRSFKSRGLISQSAASVPALACVMVCVVEFQEFCKAYGKVGDKDELVAGFQHRTVNYYGNRYHLHDVSIPLWQYRLKRLSKPCCVARFFYEGDAPAIEDDDWVATEFDATGNANAAVFWVDYLCRSNNGTHKKISNNDRFNVISTASSCHRQLVRKLETPLSIGGSDLAGNKKIFFRSKFGGSNANDMQDHCFPFKVVVENKVIS